MKRFALVLLLAQTAAADWKVFRSGSMDVLADGKDAAARQALNSLDQVRHLTARWLAKTDADTVLAARLVLSATVPPHAWFLCRDGYLASALTQETLRGYASLLLEANAQRMPRFAEEGMLDVVAQLSATGPRITLGVPAQPTKTWAGMFYLLTNEDYATRMRVFLSNLQQDAPIDIASRNSLGKPWADIEKEMDAFWTARAFQPAQLSGAPIAPERYLARTIDQTEAARHASDAKRGTAPPVAELAEEASPESKNAVALVAAADAEPSTRIARDMFTRATEVAPRWAEPHVKLAELESDLARRIPRLKKAASLRPRDARLWETLAEAQQQAQLFNDAAISYRNAERAAADDTERASIERRRRDYDQSKLDLIAAAKKKEEEEKQRELQKLKDEALARVRAAEAKANSQLAANSTNSPPAGNAAPVAWTELNGGKAPDSKLEGRIERVDCAANLTRITIRSGKNTIRLNIELNTVVITGTGDLRLVCGLQKPPRNAAIEFYTQADAKTATAGIAARIEFRK